MSVEKEFDFAIHKRPRELPDEQVRARGSMRAAIQLCEAESRDPGDTREYQRQLQPKEIYTPLGLSAPQYSRIMGGSHHFPDDQYPLFMRVCGNLAPLQWLAWEMGYGLHRLRTQVEIDLEAERKRADEAEERERFLINLIQGRAEK